jgi:hypothetical protein
MRAMALLSVLAPIMLVIALGAFLEWHRFFGSGFVHGANRLTYWVALPVLVLHSLVPREEQEAALRPAPLRKCRHMRRLVRRERRTEHLSRRYSAAQ